VTGRTKPKRKGKWGGKEGKEKKEDRKLIALMTYSNGRGPKLLYEFWLSTLVSIMEAGGKRGGRRIKNVSRSNLDDIQ